MASEQWLSQLYQAFNKREIEKILSFMQPDVKWANGVEGGFVYGCGAVREYWTKQFQVVQPQLEPLKFEGDAERWTVTVHQVVHDLSDHLLMEKTVRQIFTFKDDLISVFEIGDASQ